jgi:hypothetical protein
LKRITQPVSATGSLTLKLAGSGGGTAIIRPEKTLKKKK